MNTADAFKLATDAGIPLTPGEQAPMLDEEFVRFRDQYLTWSTRRDQALQQHLASTPTLFRVYLPYTTRMFSVAGQVVWYLDEVVTRDPLIPVLTFASQGLESDKVRVREILQFMSQFRPWIEAGFILLHGHDLVPQMSEEMPPIVEQLLAQDELVQTLQGAAHYGLIHRPDSLGNSTAVSDSPGSRLHVRRQIRT